jgi:PKD repeat protein
MKHAIRTFTLAGLIATSLSALAQQPYTVIVDGTVPGCSGNSFVNIVSLPGTLPAIDIDVPVLPPSCSFFVALNVATDSGGFTVTTLCQGAVQTEVLQYANVPMLDTAYVSVIFNCGPATDCLGVPGGTAVTGTPCTTFLNEPGVFGPDCICVPFATACNACFTVYQDSIGGAVTPFEATFFSCSSSVGGEYTLSWAMPDGSGPTGENTTYTFPGPGTYDVCLWMTGINNNCTSTFCDSVYVDENGNISSTPPSLFDCLGELNGPALPGTPCSEPGTGILGTWNADCECLPNVTLPCEAGFWVVQAYTVGDSVNNPGGGVEPIPNEVWVWNLSSGGDGNYQFFWSFGDGSSSTEAYPTHVYATGGPYQLCLTMTDGSGCTSTYCDDVSVDEDGLYTGLIVDGRPGLLRSGFTISVRSEQPTGITERELVENVALWPNPVEDVIGLSFSSLNNASLSLTIFDLNGRVVRSTNTVVNTGRNDQRINVADLEAGMYLLQITNGEQRTSRRFVKR